MNDIVYITGARGSLGSRLTPLLKKAVAVDGDITALDFKKILKPDAKLVHLAGKSNIAESKQIPDEYYRVNVDGLKRVADACLTLNIKLLFPSTVHHYGCPGPLIDETCSNLKAYSPYGATKIAGEQYLQELGKKGLKFTILRPAGTFGYSPAMKFNTSLNQMVYQAVKGETLNIWKETWQEKRPHLYIKDAVRAIIFFLKNDLFNNEIYNVVTGNFTVEETVKAIKKFIPDLKISFVNAPPTNLKLDVSDKKICDLGFKPDGNLEKGVSEIITYLHSLSSLK
ncbi:MAG: SDR family oxidoreductase [Patescibacteria group bacterium]